MQPGVGVEQVLYLYGVIPEDQILPCQPGVPLRAVSHATVTAMVETVCAREFSPQALEEKLQSVEWVACLARKHEAVLEQAMRHGPVVPARLCTLFSNTDVLDRSLADNEERFQAALERIRDREEWSIKAFCDERRLRDAAVAGDLELQTLDATIAAASPGRAFVLRTQREGRAAELAVRCLEALVDEALTALEPVAADLRLRPLLAESVTGQDEPMALNAAVLVDVPARDAFRATFAEISSWFQVEGLVFELSGPWPAYSFCDADAGEADVSAAGGR